MRQLLLLPLLASCAWAEPPGARLVDLLTEATRVASEHDCRYGIYRCSARNEQYLQAMTTGLRASKVAGVDSALARNGAAREQITRCSLESLSLSGRGQEAIQVAVQQLPRLSPEQQTRTRLALTEAARETWRSDVLEEQLHVLRLHPPKDATARFLLESFQAERDAQQQLPGWAEALRRHDHAMQTLPARPAARGPLLGEALGVWDDILFGAARTPAQEQQARERLADDLARFQGSPELLQARLWERLHRLQSDRENQEWTACQAQIPLIEQELHELAAVSKRDSGESQRQLQNLGQQIKAVVASSAELQGRGLEMVADTLSTQDVETGELSRLNADFYKQWARVLLYAPPGQAEHLKKARLCLQASTASQALSGLSQSPLATTDPTLFDFVELELRLREPGWEKRALDEATTAVHLFRRADCQPGLVSALSLQAQVYLARGEKQQARSAAEEAVQRAEHHVSAFGYTGSWAARFRKRYSKAYELLLHLSWTEQNPQQAAELFDRYQQLQLARLRESSLQSALPAPPRLRGASLPLSQELPPQNGPAASSEMAHGKGDFFRALVSLRSKHPEYEKMLAVRPVNYARLQKQIPSGTAIVQYFPADEALYVFLVTASDFKIQRVEVPAEQLRRRVSELRAQSVNDYLMGVRNPSPEPARRASQALYDVLVKPLEPELARSQTIAFIPTSFLAYVPFQALGSRQNGSFRYLIEDKSCLTLLKSADLELLQEPAATTPGTLLALGNPDGSLPAASAEAREVATLFQGSSAYTEQSASRDKLEKLPAGTRLVHLATHGVLDGKDPTQSYLVMSERQRLSVADIYGLPLNGVRLVTLSACETALAERDPGSEIASLSDAFEVAGARSVIATLWSVDDAATEKLMVSFYKGLKSGQPLSDSLRQAQLQMLRDPKYSAPFYWAAFCLYGDWR